MGDGRRDVGPGRAGAAGRAQWWRCWAKGETVEEIEGLVRALYRHAVRLEVPGPALDIVGTGGDGSNSVNISTMSAIVAAGAGARVVKHGNRSASSACGSADVLEELGVALSLEPAEIAEVAEDVGITFCFAPSSTRRCGTRPVRAVSWASVRSSTRWARW